MKNHDDLIVIHSIDICILSLKMLIQNRVHESIVR